MILISVIICAFLSGCTTTITMVESRLKSLNASNNEEFENERFEELLQAISEKDRSKVKEIFSTTALEETEDMEAGIDYLFKMVQGKVISFDSDGGPIVSETVAYGDKYVELKSWFDLVTDNRVLVSVLKNISDGKLEEAKNAVDNMQLNNQGTETNQDINRLRLAIAIEERDEENIIMCISRIVELSRLEVNTKQFKEYEEKYDLDFSEVRKSLDQDLAEYNQLELDIDLE